MPKPATPLRPDEVHVYRVRIPDGSDIAKLEADLPPGEQARAEKFLVAAARGHFVAGRAALRQLLSLYLGCNEEDVSFGVTVRGKPTLLAPSPDRTASPVHFNLSHSGELALCAFARGRDVGTDVQEHRPVRDLASLAASVCAPQELALIDGAGSAKLAVFYRCWARKEAVLKACGHGLGLPLSKIDVLSAPGELTLRGPVPELDGNTWRLIDLDVGPEYSAALAVQGRIPEVSLRDYALAVTASAPEA